MLAKLSLVALAALVSAVPVDLVADPILPMIPRDGGDVVEYNPLTTRSGTLVIEPGSTAGVYICTGSRWTGNCHWEYSVPGDCHTYNLGTKSSFGPDKGLTCALHTGSNCNGQQMNGVRFPGFAGDLFGNIQSWSCQPIE